MFKIKFLGIIFIGFYITSCKEDIEVCNVLLIHCKGTLDITVTG